MPQITLPIEPEPTPTPIQENPQCLAHEIDESQLKDKKTIYLNKSLTNLITKDLRKNQSPDFWNSLTESTKLKLEVALSLQYPKESTDIPKLSYLALPMVFALQSNEAVRDTTYKISEDLAIKLNARKSSKLVEINEICKEGLNTLEKNDKSINFHPAKQILGCKAEDVILVIMKKQNKVILTLNEELIILDENEFAFKENLIHRKYSIQSKEVQLEIKMNKLIKSRVSLKVNTPENHFEKDAGFGCI